MALGDNSNNSTNSDSQSWPMFNHDLAHSGSSASTGPITNQTLWIFNYNDTFWWSPNVVEGVIYVGSDWRGFMYALNASSGNTLWMTNVGAMSSSPAVVDGVLYTGFVGGVDALNASTGQKL